MRPPASAGATSTGSAEAPCRAHRLPGDRDGRHRGAAGRSIARVAAAAVATAILAAATGGPTAAAAQPASAPAAGPEVTWDFETGDLRGWRVSGVAFTAQPTREDRVGPAIGHQGEYWVSSFRRLRSGGAPFDRGPAGDAAQGALESQAFELPRGPLSFLIGGGRSFATRLELVVIDEDGRETRVLHATGAGSDTMQRVTWDVSRYAGRQGRIRIVDASTEAGGRVSVDDIRFASVVVPNLIGRDEAEVRRVLESRGLRVGAAGRVESRVAEGRVLTQMPRAGSRVEPGTAVDLEVAEPVRVTTPNVVGHDQQAAVRRLSAAGLTPGRVRREESRQPEGTVISQAPAANQRTRIGTAVDLVVAARRTAQVPDLMGHLANDASRLLAEADLRRGRVRQQESRQRTGTILAQSPAAHARVAADTAVDFVVAAPVMVRVPNLLGRGERAADARLDRAELRRGETTTEESREPEGTVIDQEPGAGERAAVGSAVDLVVATPVTVRVPDLLGLDEAAVETLLASRELASGIVERQTSDRTSGTVLAQEPVPGTRVVLGTAVAFVLAMPAQVTLADLAGMTEADALDALARSDLAGGTLEYRESAAAAGLVLEQWPAPGQAVEVGSAVDLVIAAVETVEIPNLVGLRVDGARQVLGALRLVVGSETRRQSRVEAEGTVLEQDPPAAARFAVGSPVDLVVAEPALVGVPEIVGLTVDDVDGALTTAGLSAGPVEPRFSLAPGGAVLAQEPAAGAVVPVGTTVAIRVSRDRVTWAGPLGAGLVAVAVAVLVGRARSRRRHRAVLPAPAPPSSAPLAPSSAPLAHAESPLAVEPAAGTEMPIPTAPPIMAAPGVSVRATPDAGRQETAAGARPASGVIVQCRLQIDGGTQRIEVSGTTDNWGRLVAEERPPT